MTGPGRAPSRITVGCPRCGADIELGLSVIPRLTQTQPGRKVFITADVGASGIEHTCEVDPPVPSSRTMAHSLTCAKHPDHYTPCSRCAGFPCCDVPEGETRASGLAGDLGEMLRHAEANPTAEGDASLAELLGFPAGQRPTAGELAARMRALVGDDVMIAEAAASASLANEETGGGCFG